VHAHAFDDDTVSLHVGFVENAVLDASVPAPEGAVPATPGRTTSTLAGRLESRAAGGTVTVSTPELPLGRFAADPYPSAGSLRIKGRTGAMSLTALSAFHLRIGLDEDEDGLHESTRTEAWDWLF
jgi:hypothetical protein